MGYVLKLMRFSPKDRPKILQFFEFLKILNKKLIIFLSAFIILIKILDLTINHEKGYFSKCADTRTLNLIAILC